MTYEEYVKEVAEHKQELDTLFEKLIKNREVLCNENGKLKKENARFKNNYQKLVNEVAAQTSLVAKESIRLPKGSDECEAEIIEYWENSKPNFCEIIRKGSMEDMHNALKAFKDKCINIYVKHFY